MFIVILWWLFIGLVIGGLGRFLVPGPNRIGLIMTILVGIVGAVAGGAATRALEGRGHDAISFIFSLVIAAVLVALVSVPSRITRHRR